MASVSCELPWPPSANHAWRAVGNAVHRSEDYRKYKKLAGQAVLEQRVKRHWTTDRLAVGLICHPPNPQTFDIDNRIKTVLDSLAAAGVIVNDKYVDMIVIARGEVHAPHGAVLVHIEELSVLSERMGALLSWFNFVKGESRAYDQTRLRTLADLTTRAT